MLMSFVQYLMLEDALLGIVQKRSFPRSGKIQTRGSRISRSSAHTAAS